MSQAHILEIARVVQPHEQLSHRTRPVFDDRQLGGNACTVFPIFICCFTVFMSYYLFFVSGCVPSERNVPARSTIK